MTKNKILLHFIACVSLLIFQVSTDVLEDGTSSINIFYSFSYQLSILVSFYTFYLFVWKHFLNSTNKLILIYLIPVGIISFIFTRFMLEEILGKWILGSGNYATPYSWFYIKDNWFRANTSALLALLLSLLENRYQNKQELMKLEQERNKAQFLFLRSQLNPHFFFNTLNFLHAKVMKHDLELSNVIQELSEMFRYTLKSSQNKSLSIKEELVILENYIQLFRRRFEGKFYVEFRKEIKNHEKEIEPLLLVPLLENAFKHGITSNKEKPVQISLKSDENYLEFNLKNHLCDNNKDSGTGVGLENIKARLNLLYPKRHKFKILKTENCFEVILKISNEIDKI